LLREVDGRRATPELIQRVAEALELPEGFFLESRLHELVAILEQDPALVDQIKETVVVADGSPEFGSRAA